MEPKKMDDGVSLPIVIRKSKYDPATDSFYAETPEGDIKLRVIFTSCGSETHELIQSWKRLSSAQIPVAKPPVRSHVICHCIRKPLSADLEALFEDVSAPFYSAKGGLVSKVVKRIVYPVEICSSVDANPTFEQRQALALSRIAILESFGRTIVFDIFSDAVVHPTGTIFFATVSLAEDGLLNLDFYSNSHELTGKSLPPKLNPWSREILKNEISSTKLEKFRAGNQLKVWVALAEGIFKPVPLREIIPEFLTRKYWSPTIAPKHDRGFFDDEEIGNEPVQPVKKIRAFDLPEEKIISYNPSGIIEVTTSCQAIKELKQPSTPISVPKETTPSVPPPQPTPVYRLKYKRESDLDGLFE